MWISKMLNRTERMKQVSFLVVVFLTFELCYITLLIESIYIFICGQQEVIL